MILLIRPRLSKETGDLGIPLGIMYLSSVLKKNGFETKIVDYTVENPSIRRIIKKYKPNIVEISVAYSLQTKEALRIANEIRMINKNIKLVAGGNPATVDPDFFLKNGFDTVIRGEGEFAFLNYIKDKK